MAIKIPTGAASVGLGVPGNPNLQAPVQQPDVLGMGLSTLQNVLGGASRVYSELEDLQLEQQKTDVQNKLAESMTAWRAYEQESLQRQGVNARGLLAESEAMSADIMSKATEGMDERAKNLFTQKWLSYSQAHLQKVSGYEAEQTAIASDSAYKAMQASFSEEVINNISSPKLVNSAIEEGRANLLDQARSRGWSPEETALRQQHWTSTTMHDAAKAMSAQGDYEGIQGLVDVYGDDILSNVRTQMLDLAKKTELEVTRREADNKAYLAAESYLEEFGVLREEEMLAQIRKDYDGEELGNVLSKARTLIASETAATERARSREIKEHTANINELTSLADKRNYVDNVFDPEHRTSLSLMVDSFADKELKQETAIKKQTSKVKAYEIMQMIDAGDPRVNTRDKVMRIALDPSLGNNLTYDDWMKVDEHLAGYQSDRPTWDVDLVDRMYRKAGAKSDAPVAPFMEYLESTYKNEPPGEKQIFEDAINFMRQGDVTNYGVGSGMSYAKALSKGADVAAMWLPEVPEGLRPELTKVLESKGVPVSDQNMALEYKYNQAYLGYEPEPSRLYQELSFQIYSREAAARQQKQPQAEPLNGARPEPQDVWRAKNAEAPKKQGGGILEAFKYLFPQGGY